MKAAMRIMKEIELSMVEATYESSSEVNSRESSKRFSGSTRKSDWSNGNDHGNDQECARKHIGKAAVTNTPKRLGLCRSSSLFARMFIDKGML